jgi:hypothetical protein
MYWSSVLNQRYRRKLTYAPIFLECLDLATMASDLVKKQMQFPGLDVLVLSRDVTTYYQQEHLRILTDCKKSFPRFFRIPYKTHLFMYTHVSSRFTEYSHTYAALCFVKENFEQEW